jgi:hypothetical protein
MSLEQKKYIWQMQMQDQIAAKMLQEPVSITVNNNRGFKRQEDMRHRSRTRVESLDYSLISHRSTAHIGSQHSSIVPVVAGVSKFQGNNDESIGYIPPTNASANGSQILHDFDTKSTQHRKVVDD